MLTTLLLASLSHADPGAANATVCADYSGRAFGLCNAYCEATDCDEDPNADQAACDALYDNFEAATGESPPCAIQSYEVRVVYSGDDSVEAFHNGAAIARIAGDDTWSNETVYSATLGSGAHTFGFNVWDVGGAYVGLGALIEVDGVVVADSSDGSFRVTSANPGATWADPGFDDSSWSVAQACSVHPWNSGGLAELTANGAPWAWFNSSCLYQAATPEAWFRTELVLP